MKTQFCIMLLSLICPAIAGAQSTANALQLTLPPAIYTVPGVQTAVYFDNIVLTRSSNELTFSVKCAIGNSEDRRWVATPQPTDVGRHRLDIAVRDKDDRLLSQASTMLHVIPQSAGAQKRVKLLVIGDSLTHASAYPNEIARLLNEPDNPVWSMLGSHRPAAAAEGVVHEGYGGWTWERFATKYEPNPDGTHRKRSSPFVFPGDDGKPELDVSRYFKETCNDERPDYIVIMLGINDCFHADPDDPDAIDARISKMFNHADRLLSALRTAAPNAETGICLTTPPNSRQEAFEANYKDRYTRWGWKRIQHRLIQRQLEHFTQRDDDSVTIIPTQLNLDPVGGYPANNGVHPNADGYKQVGATIFGWLKWRLSDSRTQLPAAPPNADVFLLPYFLGNGETGVYFAYSHDGYNFVWLNNGKVVMPAPLWREESLTRDPSILFHDGSFHMVWTTSWASRSIGYASSKDLITWSAPTKIDIWGNRKDIKNTWAPELHWDPEKQAFLVIWSTTTLQELNDNDGSRDPHGHDHRTYAARTTDFKTWSEPTLFFSPKQPEHGVIDPFIAYDDRGTSNTDDDRWVMVVKNEMAVHEGGKNLRLTFSEQMQGPYDTTLSPPIVGAGTDIVNQMGEGPSLFKRNKTWFLYWDAPGSEFSYCLATSPDLKTWTNRSENMSLPAKQMRHGTVLVVPKTAVAKALALKPIE